MTNDGARRNDETGMMNRETRATWIVVAVLVASANYNSEKIGATGFEPATSWSQTTRSTKLSYAPMANGA